MNFYDEIKKRYGNIKRTRGFYLYTEKNVRLLDMYLDGGMSILGRKAYQAPLIFKQSIDKGLTAFLPSSADYNLKKALHELFPNHTYIQFVSNYDTQENINLWKPFLPSSEKLKEMETFFVQPPFCTSIKILVSTKPINYQFTCNITAAEKNVLAKAFFDLIRIIKLEEKEKIHNSELVKEKIKTKAKKQKYRELKTYENIITVCSTFWKLENCYLFPKINEKDYPDFFKEALDSHIFISPYFNVPSILPKIKVYSELEKFILKKGNYYE